MGGPRPSTATSTRERNPASVVFQSGRFQVLFRDESAAKAAARDARAVGFLAEVHEDSLVGWLVVGRIQQPFPADDRKRYASRLRLIAATHGGEYDQFIAE
jgi:hypothetical protein